jgi:hypothetical protein
MSESAITREGLERLNQELERLVTGGRRKIAERLRNLATSEANPAESGDYLDVREEQAMLERRIAVLQERLRRVRVVDPQLGNGRIDLGERVRLRDLSSGSSWSSWDRWSRIPQPVGSRSRHRSEQRFSGCDVDRSLTSMRHAGRCAIRCWLSRRRCRPRDDPPTPNWSLDRRRAARVHARGDAHRRGVVTARRCAT